MKTVSARQANHEFSKLLSRVERGEEILITKRNKPIAVLSPHRPPLITPEREKAIQHAIDVMEQGLFPGTALCDSSGVKKCTFVNPFQRANDRLIDEILPPGPVRTSGTLK